MWSSQVLTRCQYRVTHRREPVAPEVRRVGQARACLSLSLSASKARYISGLFFRKRATVREVVSGSGMRFLEENSRFESRSRRRQREREREREREKPQRILFAIWTLEGVLRLYRHDSVRPIIIATGARDRHSLPKLNGTFEPLLREDDVALTKESDPFVDFGKDFNRLEHGVLWLFRRHSFGSWPNKVTNLFFHHMLKSPVNFNGISNGDLDPKVTGSNQGHTHTHTSPTRQNPFRTFSQDSASAACSDNSLRIWETR